MLRKGHNKTTRKFIRNDGILTAIPHGVTTYKTTIVLWMVAKRRKYTSCSERSIDLIRFCSPSEVFMLISFNICQVYYQKWISLSNGRLCTHVVGHRLFVGRRWLLTAETASFKYFQGNHNFVHPISTGLLISSIAFPSPASYRVQQG